MAPIKWSGRHGSPLNKHKQCSLFTADSERPISAIKLCRPVMSSFEGWIPATPTTQSFHDLFKFQLDMPEDRTRSHSTKATTEDELASGPALHGLATFNLEDLSLSHTGHNLTWAENALAGCAPFGPRGWGVRSIESRYLGWIDLEPNALNFIDSTYLARALCAGWFLYCHSTNHDPSPCPVTHVLIWHDISSHDSS